MEERLHYLFKRYLENKCTHQELREFLDFVRNSSNDEILRDFIKTVYNDPDKAAGMPAHVDEKGRLIFNEPSTYSIPKKPVLRRSKFITRISVAALLLVMAGTVWFMNRDSSNKKINNTVASMTRKTTDRSESKFLLLEDSTKVWLNAASSLQFPDHFDSKTREVYLSGEAFFDVKHADQIPFIIHTGKISTTVLGTAFNIKAYPGQKNITVSVSRGKVKVSRPDGWMTTLTMGQQVKLAESKTEVIEKSIPAEEVAAWQQGNIVYEDENFESIIADMQRIYNVDIRIDDPSLLGLRISTSFKKEIGIEQALQVLCKLTDTELKLSEGQFMIR